MAPQARTKALSAVTPTDSVAVKEQPTDADLPLPNLKTLYRKFKASADEPQTRIQASEPPR